MAKNLLTRTVFLKNGCVKIVRCVGHWTNSAWWLWRQKERRANTKRYPDTAGSRVYFENHWPRGTNNVGFLGAGWFWKRQWGSVFFSQTDISNCLFSWREMKREAERDYSNRSSTHMKRNIRTEEWLFLPRNIPSKIMTLYPKKKKKKKKIFTDFFSLLRRSSNENCLIFYK